MSKSRKMANKSSNKYGGKSKTRKNKVIKENVKFIEKFINNMFSLQISLKMLHWTTGKYAIHKATDDSMEKIIPLIDNFVETFLGKYNHGKLKQNSLKSIHIEKITNKRELNNYMDKTVSYLHSLNSFNRENNQDDLMGVRDSILSELNILRYLLHLER
jgi:DNA-binding ferritin-like protein